MTPLSVTATFVLQVPPHLMQPAYSVLHDLKLLYVVWLCLPLVGLEFSMGELNSAGAALPVGVLSLSAYLKFWGWAYAIITLAVALFKREQELRQAGASQKHKVPFLLETTIKIETCAEHGSVSMNMSFSRLSVTQSAPGSLMHVLFAVKYPTQGYK